MDEKTLQYMKDRVEKGEKLVKTRDFYKRVNKEIERCGIYEVQLFLGGFHERYVFNNQDFTKELRRAFEEALQKETTRLQKELDEL